MNIFQAFKLAIKSIVANKMRSLLTMLGMIIGVGSVIIIMGLMNGVTNYIVESFADMGTNVLTVTVTNTGTRSVSVDDMYEFAAANTDIFEGVSPKVSGRFKIKNGSTSMTKSVTGVGEDYLDINHLELEYGRFINYADILNRKATCVVGTYIVKELFDTNDVSSAVGQYIKINGEKFKIVGVLTEAEEGEANSADDCVYVGYSKVARMTWMGQLNSFSFTAYDADYVDEAEERLDAYLYDKLLNENLYSITNITFLLDAISSVTGMLGTVLGGIAGISLVVAGIGIMNIMLVSVTERTKEIGIRKSLGARKRDIMQQFVIEAACISALGGLLGIILGAALVIYLGGAFGLNASPSTESILLSFSISAGVGLLFGWMPARKAAGLNPIDALRSE